jgi:Family of unknown function (DUF5519)
MVYLDEFREQVSTWRGVSVQPHGFGGVEFCFGNAEIGHLHPTGILDIPMPRAIHDVLLNESLAEQHRWLPNSGWITFHIRSEKELKRGLWLARISYLRYALKASDNPCALFEQESESLQLDARFVGLLEKFVPAHGHAENV